MPQPTWLAALLVVLLPLAAGAQPAPEQPAPPAPAPEQVAPEQAAPESPQVEVYSYEAEGRRDPFVSLVSRGTDILPPGARPEGLAGLTINEIALRGIVQSRGTYVAITQAPNERTFLIREGARVFDGVVRSITADAVVFMQEVNDPLSLVKEREVRKLLRSPVPEEDR